MKSWQHRCLILCRQPNSIIDVQTKSPESAKAQSEVSSYWTGAYSDNSREVSREDDNEQTDDIEQTEQYKADKRTKKLKNMKMIMNIKIKDFESRTRRLKKSIKNTKIKDFESRRPTDSSTETSRFQDVKIQDRTLVRACFLVSVFVCASLCVLESRFVGKWCVCALVMSVCCVYVGVVG